MNVTFKIKVHAVEWKVTKELKHDKPNNHKEPDNKLAYYKQKINNFDNLTVQITLL